MIYPLLVNNKEPSSGDMGTMVIDMHHSFIYSIVRQSDGSVGLHTPLGFINVLVPFKDFMNIYEEYNSGIDRRYEEEVEAYYKDNYINIRKRKENGD